MKALISGLSDLDNGYGREDKWTRSIAVGSKEFVEDVKTELGCLAKGRKASVLNSSQATEVGIFIVRAFVKLRLAISEHKELNRKISQIERHLSGHDEQINAIIKTIKQLIQPSPVPQKRHIGFDTGEH